MLSPTASLKKKRKKKSKKLSKCPIQQRKIKIRTVSPSFLLDPEATDSEWWPIFYSKNSSSSETLTPHDDAEEFAHFFRVSKTTFEYICSLVREDLISRPPSGLINIEGRLLSVEKQVAIALRRLASGESQVSVGAAFGVGQSTVSQVTWRFIEALEERGKHHLHWPDAVRINEIKNSFEETFNLPNCCGAIEATHVVMTLPAVETSDDWCDQEKNYSMFLQGIVDHDLRFLDVVTGWPGAMNESRVLKSSGFFNLCERGMRLNGRERKLSKGYEVREYIVGGANYPLLPWLAACRGDDDVAGKAVDSARMVGVRAFLQLKGCWRILNKVMWRPDKRKMPSIILVCCLLHNMMIDFRDEVNVGVALTGHHDVGYVQKKCDVVHPMGRRLMDSLLHHLSSSRT